MSEIERAIEQLESLMYDAGHKGDIEDYNALKTAIAILRAELEREIAYLNSAAEVGK